MNYNFGNIEFTLCPGPSPSYKNHEQDGKMVLEESPDFLMDYLEQPYDGEDDEDSSSFTYSPDGFIKFVNYLLTKSNHIIPYPVIWYGYNYTWLFHDLYHAQHHVFPTMGTDINRIVIHDTNEIDALLYGGLEALKHGVSVADVVEHVMIADSQFKYRYPNSGVYPIDILSRLLRNVVYK